MTKAKTLLRDIASFRLVEEFKSIRTRGHDIYLNLDRLITEYLRNHQTINPIFQELIEQECQEAIISKEITQEEANELFDKIGIPTYPTGKLLAA